MASQWNSNIRMLSPSWPGLDPTSATLGNGEVDKSLAADLFNTAEDKAQIIFLQIPNKFPVIWLGLNPLSQCHTSIALV